MIQKSKNLRNFLKREESYEERDLKYEIMEKANEFMQLCDSCKDDNFIDDVIDSIVFSTPFDIEEAMNMDRLFENNKNEEENK